MPDADASTMSRSPLKELFAYPGKRPAADVDEDDVRELEGDLIDLEPALRDAVVPALPFQPVCRDDCPGLCSECGARLADDPEHAHDVSTPDGRRCKGWPRDRGASTARPTRKRTRRGCPEAEDVALQHPSRRANWKTSP